MRLPLTAVLAIIATVSVTGPATAQMSPTAQKMGRAMDLCLDFLTSADRQMKFASLWVAGFQPVDTALPNTPLQILVWSDGEEGAEVRYTTHGDGGTCTVGPTSLDYPQMFMQAQVQAWLGRNMFQIIETRDGDILNADRPSLNPPIEASLFQAAPDGRLRLSFKRAAW